MKRASSSSYDLREQILDVATELFVRRGYADVSFGDISERTGTTRANIHHHFSNKQGLALAALDRSAAEVCQRYEAILLDSKVSLAHKLMQCLSYNKQRYHIFNPDGDTGQPWSLITRLRLDAALLDPQCHAVLRSVSNRLDSAIGAAIGIAIARGDLVAGAPVADIQCQLVTLLRFNQFVVTDTGRFEGLERLYKAVSDTILRAYGQPI